LQWNEQAARKYGQAQLQQTQAAISDANARSQYGFAMADLRFQTGVQP